MERVAAQATPFRSLPQGLCWDAGQNVAERRCIGRRFPMKMTASTRLVGGVTIVDLSGRIVLGDGSAALRDLVRNLISEGNKKILLNLRNVDYIDSSGLGELVSAFTSMRSQGGELKLLNLTKRVRALLQITKLLTVFDITDDEATSVKSFSPAIWPSSLPESRAAV